MQLTLDLDDNLLTEAAQLLGREDLTVLIHEALTALIQREGARKLAALGGSDPQANAPPRRKHDYQPKTYSAFGNQGDGKW